MKKILIIGVALLALSSCAPTQETITYTPRTCAFEDCRIVSIHHHALYNGSQFPN